MVHPYATAPGLGLAPGIRVSIDVLTPGERTQPIRHNSTQVNFCIHGRGHSMINGKRIAFDRYDVWNTPSMAVYYHVNDSNELQVRLSYSNAALLEKMNVHIVEEDPPLVGAAPATTKPDAEPEGDKVNPFGTFALGDEGAYLMPYEKLINPDVVPSVPLHWPSQTVKERLDKLQALCRSCVGRRLYLLYNPATGRTMMPLRRSALNRAGASPPAFTSRKFPAEGNTGVPRSRNSVATRVRSRAATRTARST